jgi:hypothetical protein
MTAPAALTPDDIARSRRERSFFAVAFIAEQLADMLDVQPNYLRKIWCDAKGAGRLPNIDRRKIDPGSEAALGALAELIAADLCDVPDDSDDELDLDADAPCVRMAGALAERTCDPLLEALFREHGVDRLRRSDDDVFDDRRMMPSALCCLRLARERDRQAIKLIGGSL